MQAPPADRRAPLDQDSRYLRRLLGLAVPPRLPVLWLLPPWLGALWWSVGAVRVLSPQQLPLPFGVAIATMFELAAFLCYGGLGALLTWAWLYFAWPEHPRVPCWAAGLGFIVFFTGPRIVLPVLPLFISLCVLSAIVEQWIAARRGPEGRVADRDV